MGNPPQQPAETSAITALQPLAHANAPIDDTRAALLYLGDARLAQLEHAAPNDAAKDFTTHAPA